MRNRFASDQSYKKSLLSAVQLGLRFYCLIPIKFKWIKIDNLIFQYSNSVVAMGTFKYKTPT